MNNLVWKIITKSRISYCPAKMKITISNNVNEVIKAVLNFFIFFFAKRFLKHKKYKKHKKHKNANKRISDFSPLDVFYAHKNAAFFVFVCLYSFCAFCVREIFS